MTQDQLQQLERLALLKQQKAISEKEFKTQKALIDGQVRKQAQQDKTDALQAKLAAQTPFQRKMSKIAAVLVGIAIVLWVLIIGFSDKKPVAQGAKPEARFVGLGQTGIIRTGIVAGTSSSGQDMVMDAVTAKDEDGIKELISRGEALYVDNNTKVKVIESGILTRRVRLMSGDHKGKAVYVPSELVEAL